MAKLKSAVSAFSCLILSTSQAYAQGASTTPASSPDLKLKANGFYDAGNFLLKSKNYKEAIIKYREAIAIWPDDFHYHYNLALALKHSGNGAEAVAEFKKALEKNEKDWKCWKALGNTYWRMGQLADGKSAFESGMKCNPPARDYADMQAGVAACTPKAN